MKNKIKLILVFILILVIAAAFYVRYFRFDLSEHVTDNSDLVICFKPENISRMIYTDKENKEKDRFTIEKILKNVVIIHQKEERKNSIKGSYEYIVAADTGYAYPVVMTYFTKYFKKEENDIYVLRENDKIPESLKEICGDLKIYTEKGMFFISKSREELINYKKRIKHKNKENDNFYMKHKNKDIVIKIDVNSFWNSKIDKSYISELNNLYIFADTDKKEKRIKFNIKQYGKGKIFELTSASDVAERHLGANISTGDIYIANNNFGELLSFLLSEAGRKKNEDYFDSIENVFGVAIEDIVNLFGNEIVFNFSDGKFSGVLTLKDENVAVDYFKNIQKSDGKYNFEGLNFAIKNSEILVGEDFSEREIPKEIEQDTFLYTYGDLGRIYGFYDYRGIFADVTLKNRREFIESDILFEPEEFKKIIKLGYKKALEIFFKE